MRIPGKILLIVYVLWITAAAIAGVAIVAFEKSMTEARNAEAAREQVQSIRIIQNAVVTSSLSLHQYMAEDNWEQRAGYIATALASLDEIGAGLARFDTDIGNREPGWPSVREQVSRYQQQVRDTVEALQGGTYDGRLASLPPVADLLIVLRTYVYQMLAIADHRSAEHLLDQRHSETILVVILVAGLLTSLVCAMAIGIHGIVRPIHDVTQVLNRLAAGDTSVDLPQVRGQTEIADLWRTAHAFKSTWQRLSDESEEIMQARRKLEESLRRDSLTGLGNRLRFNEELLGARTRSAGEGTSFGLLLLDLDKFKLVNDTLGHGAGDALLAEIARRLQETVPEGSLAMRLGGDEFAVIVDADHALELEAVAESLLAEIVRPLHLGDHRVVPAISIGGALFPVDADDIASLVLAADRCLYLAKGGAAKIRLFEPTMRAELERDQTMLAQIRTAFEAGEFVVHYQPQVTAASHRHAGLEALVRWNHPTQGLLPPGAFLALAEKSGLMSDLTRVVLNDVARDIRRWKQAGLAFGRVSVNIPEEIIGSDFGPDLLARAVEEGGIDWSDLTLEVTEDVFLAPNPEIILANLRTVSERGARIALDDFGTGFASLTHLRRLAFDEIKIDRSFTADLGSDPRVNQIVRSIIELGCRLGKTTVAEGVETPEQAASLMSDGCNVLQGYLFARPLPVEATTAWLVERRSTDRTAEGDGSDPLGLTG